MLFRSRQTFVGKVMSLLLNMLSRLVITFLPTTDLIFGRYKITANGDCSHEIKRHLLLGKKSYDQSVAAVAAKSLQSCPTLCDPIDGSPPGSAVREVFQARVLDWVAIAFSDDQPRHLIKKQRHYFANKDQSSQSYGFSSGHLWM